MLHRRTHHFIMKTLAGLIVSVSALSLGPSRPAPAFEGAVSHNLLAAPIQVEIDTIMPSKFTISLGIGGAVPGRDLGDVYDAGTQMEFLLGYEIVPALQFEAGFGYVTGFLPTEGLIGIDFGTGAIIELRGSYLSTPVGLKVMKSLGIGNMRISGGGGVLYNRYSQSVDLRDAFGLAASDSDSRDGFGYYVAGAYDYFLGERFGLGAKVRHVWAGTSGKNVGGVLTPSGEDYDPDVTGSTDDSWLSIYGALLYRF